MPISTQEAVTANQLERAKSGEVSFRRWASFDSPPESLSSEKAHQGGDQWNRFLGC
jgi:hypothetical protein